MIPLVSSHTMRNFRSPSSLRRVSYNRKPVLTAQGGDTPAKPVEARQADGEGGGIKKQKSWWLGGW